MDYVIQILDDVCIFFLKKTQNCKVLYQIGMVVSKQSHVLIEGTEDDKTFNWKTLGRS